MFRLDISEKFILWKCGQVLEEAAQGSGGVTVPGSVKKMDICGIKGRGLVGKFLW